MKEAIVVKGGVTELSTAWNKIRTLSSDGKYDDAAKLEAELTRAYMEGRVKN